MLRWVISGLVLANVLYFLWSQGHLEAWGVVAPGAQREPQRLSTQIEPERLRLLNGPQGTERPALATPQPAAPAPRAPGPAAAEAAEAAASSAPAAPEPADAPPDTPRACWQAGGFNDEQAELLRAELRLLSLPGDAWQIGEVRSPGRWIVYMGRYDNAEQANRKKAELRELGVSFRDVTTQGLAPGLALGTFSSEEAAREALQQTERRGVRTARVAQERAESLTYTLRLPAITDAQRAAIDALGEAMAGRALVRCG